MLTIGYDYLHDVSSKSDQAVRTKIFAKKIASYINLQLPIVILKKNRFFQTCVIVKRTCISIFSKLGLVDQSKPCTLIYLQILASCINLQLPIAILKESILLEMHHHKTYIYVNFQLKRVNRTVITMHTNFFAKKSHKFATTNSNFFLNQFFLIGIIVKHTCILLFF